MRINKKLAVVTALLTISLAFVGAEEDDHTTYFLKNKK